MWPHGRASKTDIGRTGPGNGVIVRELGTKVNPDKDRIAVDGKTLEVQAKHYYLFNKPKGVITTSSDDQTDDGHGLLQKGKRPYLRRRSSGPKYGRPAADDQRRRTGQHPDASRPPSSIRPEVKVKGIADSILQHLADGVELKDGMMAPADVVYVDYDPRTNRPAWKSPFTKAAIAGVRRMLEYFGFRFITAPHPVCLFDPERRQARCLSRLDP